MPIRRVLRANAQRLLRRAAKFSRRPDDPTSAARPFGPGCPPDFIGVGVQKAGTTWWYRLITEHPQVHPPRNGRKEQGFFTSFGSSDFRTRDIETYHRCFEPAPGSLTGEWTPRYVFDPWTPSLIARAAPAAKVIVILRDPVERYRSGLTHDQAEGDRPNVDGAREHLLRSQYGPQLRRLLRYVPRAQLLVLQYERCCIDTSGQLERTYQFLGLDPDFRPTRPERPSNATWTRKVPLPDDVRSRLVDMLRPGVSELSLAFPELDIGLWPNFG